MSIGRVAVSGLAKDLLHEVTSASDTAGAISSSCCVGCVRIYIEMQALDSPVALSSPSSMVCCALAAAWFELQTPVLRVQLSHLPKV